MKQSEQTVRGMYWFRGAPVGLPNPLRRQRVIRSYVYSNVGLRSVRLASPARHQRYFGAWFRGGHYKGSKYIRYCFGPSETLSQTMLRCTRKGGGDDL